MAANCPEWAYADLGAMSCGALSVPVYHTEGIGTVAHILRDSGSRLLFLGSPLLAETVTADLSRMPELETIVLLEGAFDHPRVLTLEELPRAGAEDPSRRTGEAARPRGAGRRRPPSSIPREPPEHPRG